MSKLRKILLIDDDEPTNFLNSVIIKRTKCADEVVAYQRAEDALNFLKSTKMNPDSPDLIFLDINMPLMDGWEFLNHLSHLFEGRIPPKVVMLTSSINPEDENKAAQFEMITEFRSKPLSFDALDEILSTHFN